MHKARGISVVISALLLASCGTLGEEVNPEAAGPCVAEGARMIPAGCDGAVLVEAESFDQHGGWVVDQQFVDIMGSPYLLAHGLGKPVADAATKVIFPETGTYHVRVRTKDWAEESEWAPGRFEIVVNGQELPNEFGVTGDGEWVWQPGGSVEIYREDVTLELRDLTGFEGRCDAVLFTMAHDFVPPKKAGLEMRTWRKALLGLPDEPPSAGSFDVVVVGGGIAGCSAALASARLGCRVALIQNRPVFGGNASAEIGVFGVRWGKPGAFVTEEIYGRKGGPRATPAARQAALDAEPDIKQFSAWHVFAAHTDAGAIASVDALNIYTNGELRFEAPVFIDCTGDGWVGYHAGADYRYGSEGREDNNEPMAPEKPSKMVLGATIHWRCRPVEEGEATFPDVPWAEAVTKGYAATGGGWTWEYGHHRDMIWDAEEIRDYLFRTFYGSFAAANRKDPERLAKHWPHFRHIMGKRESRRLMGDYIMTQMDCWDTTTKPDKVGISNNPFDVHVPSEKYDFRIHVDKRYGGLGKRKDADIPFRSLYSRNVSNLVMAGRCISVTHIAHSSTRVMNTGSQTGIAAGAAAYLCKLHGATPREVGQKRIEELQNIVFGRGRYAGALEAR